MKSIIMFIGGFALCYWLQQEYTLPVIEVIEWSSEGVSFTVDGKEYDLNLGDKQIIGGNEISYSEGQINITKPNGQTFTMNMS